MPEAANTASAPTTPQAPETRPVGPSTAIDAPLNAGSVNVAAASHSVVRSPEVSARIRPGVHGGINSGNVNSLPSTVAMLTELQLHKLWRETNNFVERLSNDVRECKNVNAASDFARHIQWTGLLEILVTAEAPMPLPVCGRELKLKVKKLLEACNELYQDGKATPRYTESDIAEINRKLDLIAAHVATTLPITNENNTIIAFAEVAEESSRSCEPEATNSAAAS